MLTAEEEEVTAPWIEDQAKQLLHTSESALWMGTQTWLMGLQPFRDSLSTLALKSGLTTMTEKVKDTLLGQKAKHWLTKGTKRKRNQATAERESEEVQKAIEWNTKQVKEYFSTRAKRALPDKKKSPRARRLPTSRLVN